MRTTNQEKTANPLYRIVLQSYDGKYTEYGVWEESDGKAYINISTMTNTIVRE
jgi:hypothetical protein